MTRLASRIGELVGDIVTSPEIHPYSDYGVAMPVLGGLHHQYQRAA